MEPGTSASAATWDLEAGDRDTGLGGAVAGGIGDVGVGGGRAGVGLGGVGGPASGIGVRPGLGAGRAGVGLGGFDRMSTAARYTTAAAVRGNYHPWGLYGRGWYVDHPGAWAASRWAVDAAWTACAWGTAASYCGYDESTPVYYDYGDNVTYQDNSVYVNDQSVGSADEYYAQASSLAANGAKADAPPDGEWLPLGVFALTKAGTSDSEVSIQLAINREGTIRGNYTNTTTNTTQVVQGSVDKKTQRVAFTVGEDKTNLVETGLYNLTKDEAPALIHFGKEPPSNGCWCASRSPRPSRRKPHACQRQVSPPCSATAGHKSGPTHSP